MSLFDQIGGPSAAAAAVDDFSRRLIADPALTPYFDGVDMRRLKADQRSFIAAALGGQEPHLGRSMRESHAQLKIQAAHFDRIADHLVETLSDLGVSGAIIEQVGTNLAPLKVEVVAPEMTAQAG
ncbi:group I truncated hemoglobin [Mycolicibacterium iranicum]|uniref:Group 1 truncated hemoglobin n=1 Tax=Mycolicibacterium iranicum TaxID=912594 RepID=A0A178LRW3_MYCIR|nr:group 1 truncated hemoglobin [Mycolicibacterium iranicum]OAN36720.1 hemin receptor [Mycolicibacterium iranicum]